MSKTKGVEMDKDDMLLAHFQGRLSAEDTARFEAKIESDSELAAEVAAFSAARKVFARNDETPSTDGWARLSGKIEEERFKPANENTPMRLSLLQVACVAITAVAGWQLLAVPLLTPDRALTRMASSAIKGPSIQLVFAPGVSLKAVNEMLYDLEGSIVDGPTALGVYRVRFGDDALRSAAIEALKKRTDLVSELLTE